MANTKAKPRFEVSTEGMRELQSGREPWQLAKELVSNAWDESTTLCEVTLESIAPRKARLTVYDDGSGFSDIADAWTLMGHTPKRLNPTVRGRFNIGEKEILSIAVNATIYTAGKIISFPKAGGRRVRKDPNHLAGTKIVCILPWGNRQVETVIDKLKTLLTPEGIKYTVNGEAIPHIEPSLIIETTLDTVIQDRPDEPMRATRRKTTLDLYPVDTVIQADEQGWLFEMGIPIQPIECPFLVNVMQKVPLPPNRDVVRDSYLQDIYTTVLNATAKELVDVSATWVRLGVEDKEVSPEAIKEVMTKRYGDKAVLYSSDHRANEKAEQAGFEVIHGRTLSPLERETMQTAGLKHSSDVFPTNYASGKPFPENEWTNEIRQIVDYAKRLHLELIDKPLRVSIYRLPNGASAADYSRSDSWLKFNYSNLGKAWFKEIKPEVTSLLIHEFAHTEGDYHNWEFQKNLEKLAGKAVHLALDKPEIFKASYYRG